MTNRCQELLYKFIPIWNEMKDKKYGGFLSTKSFKLKIEEERPKNLICESRYLWSYSTLYRLFKKKE